MPSPTPIEINDLPDGLHVWEQLPGEPAKWYARFADLYLPQPSFSRSLLGAFRLYKKEEALAADSSQEDDALLRSSFSHIRKTPGQWSVQAAKWRWQERAIAKDRWDRKQRRRVREGWLRELEEDEWKDAQALRDRAREMMEYPIVTRTATEDGQTIIIAPAKWTAADMAKFFELSSKLGRMATGAPEKVIEPLEALRILVDAGWVPDTVIDEAGEGIQDLRDRVRLAFGGEPPEEDDFEEDEETNEEVGDGD